MMSPSLLDTQLRHPFRAEFEPRILLDGTAELLFRKTVLGDVGEQWAHAESSIRRYVSRQMEAPYFLWNSDS
jgi:hypothetical protein